MSGSIFTGVWCTPSSSGQPAREGGNEGERKGEEEEEEKEEGSVCLCHYSYDEALRDFVTVVDLKPSDTSGHINCGLIYQFGSKLMNGF